MSSRQRSVHHADLSRTLARTAKSDADERGCLRRRARSALVHRPPLIPVRAMTWARSQMKPLGDGSAERPLRGSDDSEC